MNRLLPRAALALALVGLLGTGAAAGLLVWSSRDLPRFDKLEDYSPKLVTRVLSPDGTEVAAFFDERRTVVPPEDIPEVMKRAILAAEDASFYQHDGLDYPGILRAAVKDLLPGGNLQGASTITQQVVKTFLLTPERKFKRKIKEMILARRLEQHLSKDEILYLYLNQIYFGHRRYGVEEASRFLFGKSIRDVDLGQAAMLAGVVQSPARLSPLDHPQRAKKRQTYVLDRMLDNGWITKDEHDREVARPIALSARPEKLPGAFYAEEVRRGLVDRYGMDRVMDGGLTVSVGMDVRLQGDAESALRDALVEYDRRHGWRGAGGTASAADRERLAQVLAGSDPPESGLALVDAGTGKIHVASEGDVVSGVVDAADARTASVWFGGPVATLKAGEAWPGKELPALAPGDIVPCEILATDKGKLTVRLFQEPELEGALVAIDPITRNIRALVGGFDMARSSFDRATQARRQPGSSFKPFLYGAALESGRWTAASLVVDAPETFRDPWTGKVWQPKNYEGNVYEGTLTLEKALATSKNTVAARLISELGVEPVIDFAHRAGVASELPKTLSLALGAGEVTPLELANAYATLDAGGSYAPPVLIRKVVDKDGTVLEEAHDDPRPVISPAIAYVMTRLLQDVVKEGTGHGAAVLGRPLAAKTGTTTDGKDAWFAGYTPDLVAVSWLGFDDHRTLGRGETGGHTALPAFLNFMKAAMEGVPPADFAVPEGVELADIDPATGLLAPPDQPSQETAFVSGTAPQERALAPGLSPSDAPAELFLDEPGSPAP